MGVETDPKRRRVTIACNRCRSQKLRCDGAQPRCGRCVARRTACEYPKKFVRANVSEEYVKYLEMSLRIVQSQDHSRAPAAYPVQDGPAPLPDQGAIEQQTNGNGSTSAAPAEHPCDSKHAASLKENGRAVEKLGEKLGEKPPSEFSFMCLVEAALGSDHSQVNGDGTVPSSLALSPPRSGLYICMDRVPCEVISDWKWPPRNIADSYIQSYFSYAHPLCPFIHQSSFLTACGTFRDICAVKESPTAAQQSPNQKRQLTPKQQETQQPRAASSEAKQNGKQNGKLPSPIDPNIPNPTREQFYLLPKERQKHIIHDTHVFYAIANFIFALGCLHSHALIENQDVPLAQLHYENGRECLDNIFAKNGEKSSLMELQALLLKAQFLQATHQQEECLKIVIKAVRTAQQLGLYSEDNIETRQSLTERELCRRLWYGCLVMDRSVSLASGRPMLISHSFHVKLPRTLKEDYITERSVLEPSNKDQPSVMSFFEQTIRLYGILADVLQNLYFQQSGGAKQGSPGEITVHEILGKILEFDDRLGRFKEGLPEYLKVANLDKAKIENPISRQAAILHLRYLHVSILLCRSVFLPQMGFEITYAPSSHLTEFLVKKICSFCLDCSIELINILWKVRDSNIMPSLYHTSFYVYTAAVIILAAMLKQSEGKDFGPESLDEMWKRCLELLGNFEKQGNYKDKGRDGLQAVYDKIVAKSCQIGDIMELDFLPENSSEVWGFDVDMLSNAVNSL